MTDWPHDTLVQVLSERPGDLDTLLALSQGRAPLAAPTAWSVENSALHLSPSVEVRPDLVLLTSNGRWALVEVQRAIDPVKARRWPLAASLMLDTHTQMGTLVVLTASAHVARWARSVAHHDGGQGTLLALTPTVMLLRGRWIDALLDPKRPELAFYAAWAMHERHGPNAKRVVTQALALADTLPRELKTAMSRAILSVLSDAMLAWLKEATVNAEKIIVRPEVAQFIEEIEARGEARGKVEGKAEGKVEGKAEALLTILSARGFTASEAQRATILGCTDTATLDRWIRNAVIADGVEALLAGA